MDYIESISLTSVLVVVLIIFYILLNKALLLGGLCLVLFLGFKFGIKYNTETSGALAILVCILFNLLFIPKRTRF